MAPCFTPSAFLGEEMQAPVALARWEAFLIDAVLRNGGGGTTDRTSDPPPLRAPKGAAGPESGDCQRQQQLKQIGPPVRPGLGVHRLALALDGVG